VNNFCEEEKKKGNGVRGVGGDERCQETASVMTLSLSQRV